MRSSAVLAGYNVYPFVAVIGQDDIKLALILNLINPRIGGVLISGEKGTAKSTLARGLAMLADVNIVNIPLSITEDRLVGSVDIKEAISGGKIKLEPGLFHDAHDGIIYIDEVNLLSEHITNILLEVSSTGENIVEREGISAHHKSEFVLIGSMNPEEGKLRPAFIDRFGLYVEAKGVPDVDMRREIIRRRIEYESDPMVFALKWDDDSAALAEAIENARKRLSYVHVSDEQFIFAARLARKGGCLGHRAEITTIEAARTLAALDGDDAVGENHIRQAAKLSLPHRLHENLTIQEPQSTSQPDSGGKSEDSEQRSLIADTGDFSKDASEISRVETTVEEQWDDIVYGAEVPINVKFADKAAGGVGKRSKFKNGTKRGRYVGSRRPKDKVSDLALDATIRCAAVHGKSEGCKLAVDIRTGDIREKVREHRCGATILFVVDASGSMGARRRMGAVKGAIISLLNDAYEKRDSVGLVAFRNESAEVLMGITRSAALAHKRLKELKTGGKTPLALGLMQAHNLLLAEKIKTPDALQCIVLVSDGRSNVPLFGANAFDDAVKVAGKLKSQGVRSMVFDTESGYIRYGYAKSLAQELDAEYVKLDAVSSAAVESKVKGFIGSVL